MKYSYTELAAMVDHSLLHPTLTDQELEVGCKLAVQYGVASVCIKPCAVKLATQLLRGSSVKVGTVVGFPHGNNATEVKRYETQIACRDGAREIDMVINLGKTLSGDWDYVQQDIQAVVQEAHKHGAIVKVILENDYLPDDPIKIKLCNICERAQADFVKTSTGYGFVKGADGRFASRGATEHDLRLMRAHCSPKVQVKAAGGVRDLDALVACRDLGATRVGATATAAMLEEYIKRMKTTRPRSSPHRPRLASRGH
jgi:deoxyribose-phosphate aldolase